MIISHINSSKYKIDLFQFIISFSLTLTKTDMSSVNMTTNWSKATHAATILNQTSKHADTTRVKLLSLLKEEVWIKELDDLDVDNQELNLLDQDTFLKGVTLVFDYNKITPFDIVHESCRSLEDRFARILLRNTMIVGLFTTNWVVMEEAIRRADVLKHQQLTKLLTGFGNSDFGNLKMGRQEIADKAAELINETTDSSANGTYSKAKITSNLLMQDLRNETRVKKLPSILDSDDNLIVPYKSIGYSQSKYLETLDLSIYTFDTIMYKTGDSVEERFILQFLRNILIVGIFNPNGEDQPLIDAASHGCTQLVELFLAMDQIDVNQTEYSGKTAFIEAAMNNHVPVLELLYNTGKIDVNHSDDNGFTPLMWAATRGKEAAFWILKLPGINVEQANSGGQTAYHWAPKSFKPTIAEIIAKQNK